MTAAEQATLEALRGEMNGQFSELRGLIESRRVEDARNQESLDRRLARVEAASNTNKVLVRLGGWLVATVIALAAVLLALFH